MSGPGVPRLINEEVVLNEYGKVVIEREFMLPDQTTIEYVVWGGITRPSIVFPLTETREVIAIRQFRYGSNEFVIEIPGGVPKRGQAPEEAAHAELLEETGYRAGRLIRLRPETLWFEPAACITNYIPFLALSCGKVADPKPDRAEVLEVHLIPWNEWMDMIRNGHIRDTKTIALTMLTLLFLE